LKSLPSPVVVINCFSDECRLSGIRINMLPIETTDKITEADPKTRYRPPVNSAAVAANGFFSPTAGKVIAAGLILTWFVNEITPSAFLVGLMYRFSTASRRSLNR
jgi:hypothetical protein